MERFANGAKFLAEFANEPRVRSRQPRGFVFWPGVCYLSRVTKIIPLMKKTIWGLLLTLTISSCASIFPPKATDYQKTKPAPGQPKRELRVGWMVWDCLLLLPLPVDFATGKIYKPSPSK